MIDEVYDTEKAIKNLDRIYKSKIDCYIFVYFSFAAAPAATAWFLMLVQL